ncbi:MULTISPECIES: hypothetical protein [unclassified Streptomyces]|uniref:hypothetical protein n=1 Tax=unclassified Streptomyces TaxID=2593676 RepID=UPI00325063D1
MRTNSTVRMSAPDWHAPLPVQPLPLRLRSMTRGPSTTATRRSVRRCRSAKLSGFSVSGGQQL